ncbi:MAG: hypothetical protein ABH831_01860 [Candidatus Nealsonbacteria bacterium]
MVDIIPKEAPKLPAWLNILFYILFIIFVITIISLFLLNSSLNKSLKSFEELESTLAEGDTEEEINLENDVLASQKRLQDFSFLADQHLSISKAFSVIESFTHPEVQFLDFDLNSRTGSLSLRGETESFKTLGQQMLILKDKELVTGYQLDTASINKDGRIDFSLSITLSPKLLK